MTTDTKTLKAIFHTNTTISPFAWEMLGVSVKGKDNPVGRFGTGNSYYVAVLLRTGHKITIITEEDTYRFGLEDVNFRGKDFQCVTCNGKRLSFTTEYGKDWTVGEAYREIISNTMDEDGIWMIAEDAMEGGTSIIVEGDEILECMRNHDEYFVGDRQPISESASLRIYEGNGIMFYRGVKVGVEKGCMYSYEFLDHLDLTEDRTIKHHYQLTNKIGRAIVKEIKDAEILRRFVTAEKGHFEATVDFDWEWSAEFMDVVKDVWDKIPQKLNPDIRALFKKKKPEHEWEYIEPDESQTLYIEKGKVLLKKFGYHVTAPIVILNNEDENLIAFVHMERIHLTCRAFDKGFFNFVTCLLEEHFHTVGYSDYSRIFQTYLIDELVKQSAKLHKEPI